ncbi:MAG TPA: hypothetical protein VJN67_06230 [Stellaceae bacterium]|nr:hypothetical protein [Stellaceae bacterium]
MIDDRDARGQPLYRALVFIVPLCLFIALAWLFISGHQSLYLTVLWRLGATPYIKFPFLDLHGVLAAADCHRLGIGVFLSDPCDEFHRPFDYSPLWLDLLPGFFRRENVNPIGITLDLMFIASLPLIMRPRSAGQCLLFIAAVVSTTVIYALESANADVIIFILMTAGGLLLAAPGPRRLAAYSIFFLGGLLKFYPFALLMLIVCERWRRAFTVAAIAVAALLSFWWAYGHEIALALAGLTQVSYYDGFSARNLPLGVTGLLPDGIDVSRDLLAVIMFLILGICSVLLVSRIVRALDNDPRALGRFTRETAYLLIGAIVLTGCFLAVSNIYYRGIFLLMVLPGLLQFRDNAATLAIRRLFGLAVAAILFLLWEARFNLALSHVFGASVNSPEPGLAWAVGAAYWLARELLWWGLISLFVALIIALFSRMPLASDAALLLRREPAGRWPEAPQCDLPLSTRSSARHLHGEFGAPRSRRQYVSGARSGEDGA